MEKETNLVLPVILVCILDIENFDQCHPKET